MANLSMESVAIPARSFYSGRQSSPKVKHYAPARKPSFKKTTSNSTSPKSKPKPKSPKSVSINLGFAHKTRRHSQPKAERAFTKPLRPLDINFLLNNMKNPELRNRIETKRQVKKVHDIFRTSENPIALARPLRALNIGNEKQSPMDEEVLSPLPFEAEANEPEFSDLDSFSENDDDDNNNNNNNNDDDLTEKDLAALNPEKGVEETNDDFENEMNNDLESLRSASELQDRMETSSVCSSRSATPNRKFFKSGLTSSIPKEVRITDNIRAMVCNGRMTLISEKKPRQKKLNANSAVLADAKAAVKGILKNLNDVDEIPQQHNVASTLETSNENSLNDIELPEMKDYSEYRKRIPYGTNDPVRTEEQHFLLDFLITHNICNEENFRIFIADTENHRDEAAAIVTRVLSMVGCDMVESQALEEKASKALTESDSSALALSSEELSKNSEELANNLKAATNVASTESETDSALAQSSEELESLTNATNTPNEKEKLFPIFYNGKYKSLEQPQTQRRQQRSWHAGFGQNQLQIDAGQKDYGAKQCKQCGLVYTVHEPEEEKLHRDFHSSLHVLRFKGWIDEDCVVEFPVWGRDGRIIRLTENTHIKRRERLNEILKIVDKELGFSSYIIPKIFAAFLAVRNCQIVGVCLVQPLQKANKYFRSETGIDCCTIEEFEAKCGVSRIWVSPLHRRLGIGKKLIEAVRMNTIMGEEIPLSKIAFSAPTEDGKRFAHRITGTEQFLVYQ